jgi:Zn-dependent M28 family amino/carboxypeptidase
MFKTNQNPTEYSDYPDVPFFMVSRPVGDTILDRTSSGYKLRINFDVEVGPMDLHVVVGDLKARSDTEKMVMFTAHHDTCYNTVGAIDNTVGPATLIEIARSLSEHETEKNIRFCTFGGEEEGLFGSVEYYNAHRNELNEDLDLVMNFDMAHTDKESMSVGIVSNCNDTISTLKKIGDKLLKIEPDLERYTISFGYDELNIKYSDYWPFVDGGSKGIAAWGSGCEEYHTYKDDTTHLNPESLQIEARILGSYALIA